MAFPISLQRVYGFHRGLYQELGGCDILEDDGRAEEGNALTSYRGIASTEEFTDADSKITSFRSSAPKSFWLQTKARRDAFLRKPRQPTAEKDASYLVSSRVTSRGRPSGLW